MLGSFRAGVIRREAGDRWVLLLSGERGQNRTVNLLIKSRWEWVVQGCPPLGQRAHYMGVARIRLAQPSPH